MHVYVKDILKQLVLFNMRNIAFGEYPLNALNCLISYTKQYNF